MTNTSTVTPNAQTSEQQFKVWNTYWTSLNQVQIVDAHNIAFSVVRPPIKMKGGFLSVFEGSQLTKTPLDRQRYEPGTEITFEGTYTNNTIDFTKGQYVIAWGPNWDHTSAQEVAATQNLQNGEELDNQFSALRLQSAGNTNVTCTYQLPEGILQNNTTHTSRNSPVSLIIKEGDNTGYGDIVTQLQLDTDAPATGIVSLDTELTVGEEYNIGIYLYSKSRFVAGASFQLI